MASLLDAMNVRRSYDRSGGIARPAPSDSLTGREQTLMHWRRLRDIDRETVTISGPFRLDWGISHPLAAVYNNCGPWRIRWDTLDNLVTMWRRK